jgi:hypothetical protein
VIRIIGLTKCVHCIEVERLVGYEGKRIVVAWVSMECGLPPTNQMVRESQSQDRPVHFTEINLRCLAVYVQYSHLGKPGTKLVYMQCGPHSILLQAKVRACSVNPTLDSLAFAAPGVVSLATCSAVNPCSRALASQ